MSLALSIAGVWLKPTPTFYLLPTRAWELLVGSVLALGLVPTASANWQREVGATTGILAILAAVTLYTRRHRFPWARGPRSLPRGRAGHLVGHWLGRANADGAPSRHGHSRLYRPHLLQSLPMALAAHRLCQARDKRRADAGHAGGAGARVSSLRRSELALRREATACGRLAVADAVLPVRCGRSRPARIRARRRRPRTGERLPAAPAARRARDSRQAE